MKKAVCISCTHHYRERLVSPEAVLREMGYECTYITSDFSHNAKQHYKVEDLPHCIQIPTKPYQKNISPQRIISHIRFARDAFAKVAQIRPDIVYVEVPPNSLCRAAARYKRKYPEAKLVLDVFDMWPETFPNSRAKKLLAPVFKVWAALRDRNLGAADFVVTECEMFRQKLRLKKETSQTVWLCADAFNAETSQPQLCEDALELCYLGAINNIINIPAICDLIRELTATKPVVLHIIGKGERQEEFVAEAEKAGAKVIFYGAVYDEVKKAEIMNRCHFGLNIMKSSVCIGLTMKSVDYFRFGLPIINNIPGDTKQLVQEKGIGVQLEADCARKLLSLTKEDCLAMRQLVNDVFRTKFEKNVILEQYRSIFKKLK